MNFSWEYFMQVLPEIIAKSSVTLQLTVIAAFFSIMIGVIVAVIRYYQIPVLEWLAKAYVSIIRGTPVVAQLYFFYFGLAVYSEIVRKMDPLTACAIVMSLNVGAFMSESIRGALLSVDDGQKEAAFSLGMNRLQLMHRIIIPQAIRVALPPLFNDLISLVKMSSLAFMLGVADIMGAAKIEGSKSLRFFEVYAAVMLVYWLIIQVFNWGSRHLEKRSSNAY